MALPPIYQPSLTMPLLWHPARNRMADSFDAAAATQRSADSTSDTQPWTPELLLSPDSQTTTAPSLLLDPSPQYPESDDELPDWAPLLLGPLDAPALEPPVPPATADYGRSDYEVQPGDTLNGFMSEHDVTQPDLEWVNDRPFPDSGNADLIRPGETIVVLDAERNAIARAQREALTNDEDPRRFIVQEMHYATSQSPVPGDALDDLKAELKARRPNDEAWAQAVDDAGEAANEMWATQGRTHAVFDPLYTTISEPTPHIAALSFSDEVHNQFVALATTTPTREAIENHRDMLLAYGPQDNVMWQNLVRQEAEELLESGPQRAADAIEEAYETEQTAPSTPTGAYLAAEKLAELTDPEKVDPLTAALIMDAAGPTISRITTDFVNPATQLTHESDMGVTGEYGEIYRNLSIAADSAARSPLGQEQVESMARTLQAHGAPYVNARAPAADGQGTALSLAIAYELRMNGDDENANRIENEVLDGVRELKDRTRDSVIELGTTAMPFIDPQANWSAFLPDSDDAEGSPFRTAEETQQQHIDDQPGIVEDIESDMERINREGYQLTRAMTNLSQYLDQAPASPNEEELLQEVEAPDPADEPELSLALAVSTSGMTEVARLFNEDGIDSGALADPSKVVPDWSWASRMVRNHIQADVRAATGTKPFGLGLSLYGTGTYLWGLSNKDTKFSRNVDDPGYLAEQGWRDLGFFGLYGSGVVIEGTQVISRALSTRMGLDGSESGLRGIIGRIGNDTGKWSQLFRNHLSWFGWFNAAGTANYALQGEWLRASALGVAAGGTFISSYPAAQKLVRLGKVGGPVVGTAMTLIGSSALALIDMHEQVERGNATADDGRAYLIAAGVDPDIAAALERDDGDLLSVAGRLSALAEYRDTTPQEVLRFLNEQEPRDVFDLAYAAQYVKPQDDGSYPIGEPANQWRDETPDGWDNKAMIRPLNTAELNEWVDHFMPGFPQG